MDAVDAGIFEAWLASTDDGVVAVDAEGRVVLHNAAASRVTGLAPSAARQRPWRDVLRLDPAVSELLWATKHSGQPTTALTSVLCAQGNVRTAEALAQPWTDTAGRTGLLIMVRDITVLCRSRSGPGGRTGYGGMVGADPVMTALYDLIEAIAPSDVAAVIEGEPGVGKELVAQAIHARSRRSERPLIVVDCGAVPPPLLEAELFGRVRPGAHGTSSLGRVELAHSGTLLLDRVSAASRGAQARLLRLLETGMVEREGEGTPRPVDVRVIAATTQPLDLEVRDGRFQADLLRRLQVVRLRVPPLRERRGDIALLGDYFLSRHGAPTATLSAPAASVLQACDWPGNVRQLENLMREVAAGVTPGVTTSIEPQRLPEGLITNRNGAPPAAGGASEDRRTVLLRALSSHGGNRTAAARALGIGRATFYRWWREAGLGA